MSVVLAIETYRKKNIGTYLRTAVAFGCKLIVVVGSPIFSTHGAHGAQKYVQIVHFYTWPECVEFAEKAGLTSIALCPSKIEKSLPCTEAVEIINSTQVMLVVGGREGLDEQIIALCAHSVHAQLPFPGLDTYVSYDNKIALCFQEFASNIFSAEVDVVGEKFMIDCNALYRSHKSNFRKNTSSKVVSTGVDQIEYEDIAGLFE
jgi:tRNA(Leu) C34 or U34 (ribose-2'-O)-methylase TrmL